MSLSNLSKHLRCNKYSNFFVRSNFQYCLSATKISSCQLHTKQKISTGPNVRKKFQKTNGSDFEHKRYPPASLSSREEISIDTHNMSDDLRKLSSMLRQSKTLVQLSRLPELLKELAIKEEIDPRACPIYLALVERISEAVDHEENIQNLLDIFQAVQKFSPPKDRAFLADRLASKIVSLSNNITLSHLLSTILLFCHSNLKGVKYALWVKIQLNGSLKKFNSQDTLNIISALTRWCPGSFSEELKALRAACLKDLLEITEFDDVIKRLNILRMRGLLDKSTINTIKERYLNLSESLSGKQRVILFSTLSRLRIVSMRAMTSFLFPQPFSAGFIPANELSEILISLCLISSDVLPTVEKLLNQKQLQNTESLKAGSCINIAYTICFYNLQGYKALLNTTLSSAFLKNDALMRQHLLRLHEISASLGFDFKACKIRIPQNLLDEAEALEAGEIKHHSKMDDLQSIREVLSSLPTQFSLDCELDKHIKPYHAQLVDEKRKFIVEVDFIQDHTSKLMRHRHFGLMGYKPVVIRHWQWKKFKSINDKKKYLIDCVSQNPHQKNEQSNASRRIEHTN